MKDNPMTNFLLFIIAACLLFGGKFVRKSIGCLFKAIALLIIAVIVLGYFFIKI